MKMAEASQQQQQLFVAENIPPVRGSNCPVSFCKVIMASIVIYTLVYLYQKESSKNKS